MQKSYPHHLCIPSLTPQNLERGVLWFKENFPSLKHAERTHSWWRDNLLILEKDMFAKPFELSRKFLDLGYERTSVVQSKGVFAARGGTIEIWSIAHETPIIIEFHGNTITALYPRLPEKELPLSRMLIRGETAEIQKLPEGSFVVHVDHGIGIFRGIHNAHYYTIEYASPAPGRNPDRLLVPIDQKDRLTPYIGFETPRLHRLGGAVWFSTRRKAREEIEKLAKELLRLYAQREQASRPPYAGDPELDAALRATFPYEETSDQQRAEEEIRADFLRTHPMDRVVCGDVGFGKTELAIRAALTVIASGKQVAVLAPTTILAAQHEKTFRERFKNLPVRTAAFSRLTPPSLCSAILRDSARGHIDCLIGTHRLLSRDLVFKNLGLLIIDEEQRFGVTHKEHFKNLRAEIDVLSLSATPIPRTLHLTLSLLRDISVLATPPPERIPIATHVLPYAPKLIGNAIMREYERGGQIYFLHNRIETIGTVKQKLEKLLKKSGGRPEPSIGIIHGRMKEKEIMRVMDDFREKKIHILLATTIIENGLDIASANTLIVDDATRLGLAQAHQLRGRIGRGSAHAYAYFFYRPRHLTKKSSERLEALIAYSELGSGYQLALRDLELRGTGNILGKEQSGTAYTVGLNLYYQMLAEAVENESNKKAVSF